MNFKINIPNGANELIHILQNNGYKAYIVGGCVRDSILGREPHDWDICTSATPTEMLEIFKDKRVIETGLKHGTITVLNYGQPYEITTFRIDGVYLDNRRPNNVTFTSDIIEDLKRRDFTINAMAYNDEEGLIDPFDGIIDIENKIIRMYYFIHFPGVCRKRRLLSMKAAFQAMPRPGRASGDFTFLFVYKTNLYKARKERKIFAYKRQWKEFLISLPVRLCFPFPCWRRQMPIY